MENEMIETVLTEILGELKQSNHLNQQNNLAIIENKNRLISIEKKLESKDALKTLMNTGRLEQIISTGIDNISAMIDRRPEKVRREFRVLLFPEHNTKEYYRVVFGRIIFWLVILVIAKYSYLLGSEWITKDYENQKYKKSWENLYKHQEKGKSKTDARIINMNYFGPDI